MKSISQYVYSKNIHSLNVQDYEEYKKYINKYIFLLPSTK